MTNNLFFKISLFLLAFFAGFSNAFSEEAICRLTMCGENFGINPAPNIFKTRGETLRVYVKYGDLVQIAECDASGVTVSIGQKRGLTADPCDTYVEITVLPGSNAPERNDVTITLFGRDLVGSRTKTCSFKINIRYAVPSVSSISVKKNGAALPNNELIAGVTYQMTVIGTNVDRLNFFGYESQNHMLSLTKRPNATPSAVVFDVRFDNGVVFDITYWYDDRICGLGVTTFRLANAHGISDGVELLDDGLQGKYAVDYTGCAGGRRDKAVSNRRTLERVREQIPNPVPNNQSLVTAREITWPDIKWGVKNIGRATTTTFTIELRDGNTVLQRQTINGLAKNENKLFFFTRPKSLKKLYRTHLCQDQHLYLHRDINTVEAYQWSDPAKFTIVIDVANAVEEVNEDNNIGEY